MTFDPIEYINTPRWRASKYGLHRISALMEHLGNPQERLKFVHVAGTNGKGSTCAYLATILHEAGFKAGMFTSPYLFRFEERIQVDGVNISHEDLMETTLRVREAAEAVEAELGEGEHPTEFELMTAVALAHFERVGCDIVVLEVGLGGTLDSTNVIPAPEVCVITRIGLDHTALLGDTLGAISREKAGIIKPGAAVVKQADVDEVMAVFEEATARQGCPLRVAEAVCGKVRNDVTAGKMVRSFEYAGAAFDTQLLASYQPQNAACALAAVDALRERGWGISEKAVRQGVLVTAWPARFEVVASDPVVIVDGGHNPQGAQALVDSVSDVFPGRNVVFVMGVLADKDYPAMVRIVLPIARAIVTITPPNPRALPAEDLSREVMAASCEACGNAHDGSPITHCSAIPTSAAPNAASALAKARVLAGANGVVVAFGSLYSVAECVAALRG